MLLWQLPGGWRGGRYTFFPNFEDGDFCAFAHLGQPFGKSGLTFFFVLRGVQRDVVMTKNLNDMIAKLTLNWLTDLADLHAECSVFKFSDHSAFAKPPQVTAHCAGACISGRFLSELGEVRSML